MEEERKRYGKLNVKWRTEVVPWRQRIDEWLCEVASGEW